MLESVKASRITAESVKLSPDYIGFLTEHLFCRDPVAQLSL